MAALLSPESQGPANARGEQAAAYQRTIAYSGRCRVEPPDRFVTSVDFSLWPHWPGSKQARTYKISDDVLDIVTDPALVPEAGDDLLVAVLSWVREAPRPGSPIESAWRA